MILLDQMIPDENVMGAQEEVQIREQDFGNFQVCAGVIFESKRPGGKKPSAAYRGGPVASPRAP